MSSGGTERPAHPSPSERPRASHAPDGRVEGREVAGGGGDWDGIEEFRGGGGRARLRAMTDGELAALIGRLHGAALAAAGGKSREGAPAHVAAVRAALEARRRGVPPGPTAEALAAALMEGAPGGIGWDAGARGTSPLLGLRLNLSLLHDATLTAALEESRRTVARIGGQLSARAGDGEGGGRDPWAGRAGASLESHRRDLGALEAEADRRIALDRIGLPAAERRRIAADEARAREGDAARDAAARESELGRARIEASIAREAAVAVARENAAAQDRAREANVRRRRELEAAAAAREVAENRVFIRAARKLLPRPDYLAVWAEAARMAAEDGTAPPRDAGAAGDAAGIG